PPSLVPRRAQITISTRNNPLAAHELEEAKRLMKACLKGKVDAALTALRNGARLDYMLGELEETTDNSMVSGWGPPALLFAALIPDGNALVSELLAFGADPNQRWTYQGDWDPEDCYMDTDEVGVSTVLEQLSDQGHSPYLDTWAKGQNQLKDLGFKRKNGHLKLRAVDKESMASIRAALGEDT
ncbi:MAG: hypothetical protein VYE15_02290, partial [Myxococcota bacterium]|nr:hypothetical protein [Myxococcota bacterium]